MGRTHDCEAEGRSRPDKSVVVGGPDHQATLTRVERAVPKEADTAVVEQLKRFGEHVSSHACLIRLFSDVKLDST
jgi:hypothetical protein